jgi:ADP-L-glycero-D-manno-heptose 6-epimerase
MTKRIVITGGAGFIGSILAHALCQENAYKIAIADTFGKGQWHNLVRAPIDEIILPNNLFYWLEMYGEEVEAIIHLGGVSATTETDLNLILESNHSFTLLLWRWCIENDKRFIYASSAEVYGLGEHGFDDTLDVAYMNRLRPLNPNGWSKKIFDIHVAHTVARQEKTPPQWAGLRFFNVYGPHEYHKNDHRSVLNKLYQDASHGVAVKLFKSQNPKYSDGAQERDFIYVKDCVAVIQWLLKNPNVSGLFNVGAGVARSFNDLAKALFAAIGKPPQVKYIDMPDKVEHQYQYHTQAKMDRLRAAGYTQPFTALEDGVKDYVQNYLLKKDPYL